MHFSCIRTFLFFLLIFVIDWYSFASLSLSLFLSDSLRMEPKSKTTPSWNPILSEASSSSDPTPSHVRFCDDKAHQDFSKNFSKRGTHLERHVILSDISYTDLPTIIHRRGWESLYEIPVSCSTMII